MRSSCQRLIASYICTELCMLFPSVSKLSSTLTLLTPLSVHQGLCISQNHAGGWETPLETKGDMTGLLSSLSINYRWLVYYGNPTFETSLFSTIMDNPSTQSVRWMCFPSLENNWVWDGGPECRGSHVHPGEETADRSPGRGLEG